ncbi:unnamed protein product [Parnassius apollo]|uniref:(apollo) hypothetical protein n=1 Tax=Parnassius apollo TaxID=110799 RepID=A0A8S3XPL6_PARAO|nr:unnamed protein product [Parnassius apollo]
MKLYKVLCNCKVAMKSLKETEMAVTIKAPWGNLAALTWGEPTSPPVLLCPGRMEPCTAFRPLVLSLPAKFFYIAMDLPGNGWSDPLPLGVRFTVLDLVPSVLRVVEHFKREKFVYIGHSLGVAVGKFFNIAYPGLVTKMVELDPIPAYFTNKTSSLKDWYHLYYGNYYKKDNYIKHNAGKETAPRYSYDKIKELVQNVQGLTEEALKHQLERLIEPAGNGLYRFTYDQRMKNVTLLPFPSDFLKEIYTEPKTPTFAILANDMIKLGAYKDVPFVTDVTAWPNKNFKFKIVPGGHDVHLNDPDCMAEDISKFLLEDVKSKL